MFEEISANYEFILNSISDLSQIRTQIADKQQIETNILIADGLNQIGKYSKARTFLQTALLLNKKALDPLKDARIYNLISQTYLKEGNKNYSNLYAVKALTKAKVAKSNREIASCNLTMARLSADFGDYTKSILFLDEARKLISAEGIVDLNLDLALAEAQVSISTSKFDAAVSQTQAIVSGKGKYRSAGDLLSAYELLSKAYYAQNNYKQALPYARLEHLAIDKKAITQLQHCGFNSLGDILDIPFSINLAVGEFVFLHNASAASNFPFET